MNIGALIALQWVDTSVLLDRLFKRVFDMCVLVIIISTWSRLFLIIVIMKEFALLLMTILTMLGSATNFFILLIYFMFGSAIIMYGIFADTYKAGI